jgi:hypothetical protein
MTNEELQRIEAAILPPVIGDVSEIYKSVSFTELKA